LQDVAPVIVAAILLALVGMVDDIRAVEALPRLVLQVVAVGTVIAALPDEARVVAPFMPFWIERALLLLAGVWFVNLVNFMDVHRLDDGGESGADHRLSVVIGFNGGLPVYAIVVAIALCGAMLGFAPFNQPVARLFLGDVGSLPIGLCSAGSCCCSRARLCRRGVSCCRSIILPNATATLLRLAARGGEKSGRRIASHFYQRAIDGGFTCATRFRRAKKVFVLQYGLASRSPRRTAAGRPSPLDDRRRARSGGVVLVPRALLLGALAAGKSAAA
jgi:UDP-N-acetylmuramyl pentapeptide phosphotransferase/UDP-N-acetylglucosamine-1-phosphate transferase